MHVVFDAFAVKPGSAAITLDNLLRGWLQLDNGDRLTVLAMPDHELPLPAGVAVETASAPMKGSAGTIWLRSFGVRRACRRLKADALVSVVTASAFAGAPCPRGAIVYDMRHELRPSQFSRQRRVARRVSYGFTFRTTGALFSISNRTRDDIVRNRPRLASKVVVARYGADHVDAWPAPTATSARYALAFGQFANKNVDKVIDAWAEFCRADSDLNLRLVGMSRADREAITERLADLGIADRVDLAPWLDDDAFRDVFVGASLIVFPSDFEGFGLPAVEAMRLRIPLVVSTDAALAEVTGGHATIALELSPRALSEAFTRALNSNADELAAAYDYTEQFKWRHMAQAIRGYFAR